MQVKIAAIAETSEVLSFIAGMTKATNARAPANPIPQVLGIYVPNAIANKTPACHTSQFDKAIPKKYESCP